MKVERQSLGRVLDLTMDSRWHKFMTEPHVPRDEPSGPAEKSPGSPEIKHELYAEFFKEFQTKNKIDINGYDAVIGPEYVRGGKQLNILHKNGLPRS